MKVSIEKQSDGTYIAYNTDGEHCTLIGTGDTVKEAKEDFFNTIEEVRQLNENFKNTFNSPRRYRC